MYSKLLISVSRTRPMNYSEAARNVQYMKFSFCRCTFLACDPHTLCSDQIIAMWHNTENNTYSINIRIHACLYIPSNPSTSKVSLMPGACITLGLGPCKTWSIVYVWRFLAYYSPFSHSTFIMYFRNCSHVLV